MRRIISVSLFTLALTAGTAQVPAWAAPEKAPLELAANAPSRHVVVPGDTLWGISAKFLKQPYRWPELWRMNADEVKNPHRIYPGQVLVMEMDADGRPRLRLEGRASGESKMEPRIYETPQKTAIASIPFNIIQPYLAQPQVMSMEELDALPRIVATDNSRVVVGAGDQIFATGITDKTLNWSIYRVGNALKEPGSREIIGYEAVHLGNARLVATGSPATLRITRSKVEISAGDRLIPVADPEIVSYAPHLPQQNIRAHILGIYGAVGLGGQYSVVTLSRGKQDGLEVGHVLGLETAGRSVDDRFNGIKTTYQTPDQRTGMIFVFKVFDRIAYGLIMTADNPVRIGDVVHTPGQ